MYKQNTNTPRAVLDIQTTPPPPHPPSSGQKTPCWVDRAGPGIFTIPTNEAHSERVKKFAYSN